MKDKMRNECSEKEEILQRDQTECRDEDKDVIKTRQIRKKRKKRDRKKNEVLKARRKEEEEEKLDQSYMSISIIGSARILRRKRRGNERKDEEIKIVIREGGGDEAGKK